jgi:phosphoribosylaminoimidazole-succinocarboxamide synthase
MPHELVLASQITGLPRIDGDGLCDRYGLDHELLLVHLDRLGARGATLPTGVPDAGRVASQLTTFWCDAARNVVPSHFLTDDAEQIRRRLAALGAAAPARLLEGRAQLVNRTRPLPVLCDVIGSLFDDDWEEYQATGGIAGQSVPTGLSEGDSLADPLLVARSRDADTPLDGHALQHALEPGHARQVEAYSRALFALAAATAREKTGLRLSRARFEYGVFDGTVVLIGCPLTPETASFREAAPGFSGAAPPDVARGPLDHYLQRIHWQGGPHLPVLPDEVVSQTAERYRALFTRLTGLDLI